jgi:asparagine synthase (glutamine-hydrolysing)
MQETSLVALVTDAFGGHSEIAQHNRDFLGALIKPMDQPSIDGVNTWFVAKAVEEAGLKIALSRLGGGELLAGYPSFADIPADAAVPVLSPRCLRLGLMARPLIRALAPSFIRDRPKVPGLLEDAHSWAGLYLLRRGLSLPDELKEVMDPAFAREGLRRLQPLRRLARTSRRTAVSMSGGPVHSTQRTRCATSWCAIPIGLAWPTAPRSARRSSM